MDIPMDLKNYHPAKDTMKARTILITGAGAGLGRALALRLADLGATIILLGKTTKKLEQVYDEIEARGGPQPAIFPMDLAKADEQAFVGLADAVAQNFTKLDSLILNAATLGQHGPVIHLELEQWQRAIQTNLTANFLFCKHFAGLLNVGPKSSLTFVSDSLANQGRAYWGCYATMKAAVENLIQTVADEREANTAIHANIVQVPTMQTSLRRQAFPAEDPRSLPEPELMTTPFIALADPGQNWPRGQRLRWDSQSQTLTII
jgi:NAD(P)-dependent dehydrogenase (short-subunit alcohol dehydrogenase family)